MTIHYHVGRNLDDALQTVPFSDQGDARLHIKENALAGCDVYPCRAAHQGDILTGTEAEEPRVGEVDPELERLLAEEEEIERRLSHDADQQRGQEDIDRLMKQEREDRMQGHETKAHTLERHKAVQRADLPDHLFHSPEASSRQTWTVRMMREMLGNPGFWFVHLYFRDDNQAAEWGPKSTAALFNGAHETKKATKKATSYQDFIKAHGGRFYAEYTPEPLAPGQDPNPDLKRWAHILRVKWEPLVTEDPEL